MKSFKKLEFVKKMFIINFIFVILITISTFICVFMSGFLGINDLSPLTTIVSCSWVELGTYTGFYCWKSKCENIHKYPDIQAKYVEISEKIDEINAMG